MSYDSLEPLAASTFSPWQLAGPIVGCLMMLVSCLPRPAGGKDDYRLFTPLFTAGLIVGVVGIFIPQLVAGPDDDALKHNAEAVQSWAGSEYDISIKDGVALNVVRDLDNEHAQTGEFLAQGPDGELKVRIEIIDGEMQLTAPSEVPKASD